MLSAWLTGLLMGLAGSMPIAGPTSMLVLSFGLHGRARAAAWLALGSALPEGIWAGLALWGFAALVESYEWVKSAAEIGAALILIVVGLLLVLRPPTSGSIEGQADEGTTTTGDARTFLLGLSLTGLNPTLIFNWGAAVALAVSLGAVAPSPQMAIPFGFGVVSGIVAWFGFVLVLLERHHRRISPGVRKKIMRVMGVALIGLGAMAAVRLLYVAA